MTPQDMGKRVVFGAAHKKKTAKYVTQRPDLRIDSEGGYSLAISMVLGSSIRCILFSSVFP